MTQAEEWGVPRDPGESGTPYAMATLMPRLDENLDAILSGHSGTGAPGYAVLGTVYLDTSATPHPLRIWDGAQGPIIGYLDATAHTFVRFPSYLVTAVGVSAATSYPANTATRVRFLEQSDPSGAYALGVYTAPVTGLYAFAYNVILPGQGSSGFTSIVDLYVNGAIRERGAQFGGSYVGTRGAPSHHELTLTAGQSVEIYVTHTHTSSIALTGDANGNDRFWFKARRVE